MHSSVLRDVPFWEHSQKTGRSSHAVFFRRCVEPREAAGGFSRVCFTSPVVLAGITSQQVGSTCNRGTTRKDQSNEQRDKISAAIGISFYSASVGCSRTQCVGTGQCCDPAQRSGSDRTKPERDLFNACECQREPVRAAF